MGQQFKVNRSGSARVLSPDELSELIRCLKSPHDLIIQICYYTAARITEVTLLRGEDIDLGSNTLVYRAGNTKTKESRTAHIPQALHDALVAAHIPATGFLFPAKRSSGQPRTVTRNGNTKTLPPRLTISPQAVDKAVRLLLSEMGVRGASLHSFRRSMATHLQGEGLNLADIASVTGHKDLASLSHYLDADGDRATAALERIAARVR